ARETILCELAGGVPMVVVGTQSLLSETVAAPFARFGVIDEQHRFGVAERDALDAKGSMHVLTMSATPIPRTLAISLLAGTDVSVLDEKPKGRMPIDTRWIHPDKRHQLYAFVRKEAANGRQAYVVCPRIDADSGEHGEEATSAAALFERLTNGWLKDLRVGLLHGQM